MRQLTTVIPVYNGERFLAETLQSVARQTRRPDRLIILDNCSTDGTQKIVEQFKDLPCEWRQNESNLGLFGNLNRALKFAAETDFLHILHADDVIKPEFYDALLQSPGTPGRALYYCQCDLITETGQLMSGSSPGNLTFGLQPVALKRFLVSCAELRPFYFPTVVLRTAGLSSPCEFRLDMPQLADLVFWAEWAARCGQVIESSARLCQYRVHPNNDTSRNLSSLQAWVMDEWKAMQLISAWLKEKGLSARVRRQKLKCIFAARSNVKIQSVRTAAPGFAREIQRVTRAITGPLPWALGKIAVGLRDFLHYTRAK